MTQLITAGRWFLQMVNAMEENGIDTKGLCKQVGISYDELTSRDGRVDIDLASEFWLAVAKLFPANEIGLTIASKANIGKLKALGYSFLSSETVLESCQRLIRYQKLMGDAGQLKLEHRDKCYALSVNLIGNTKPVPHQPVDAGMVAMVNFISWILGEPVKPKRVLLKRPAPSDLTEYEKAYHCLPEFGQKENSLIFDEETANQPLPTANKALADLHDQITSQELDAISAETISSQVRDYILSALPSGEVTMDSAMERLNLKTRTFQRKLKEEGYTFNQLLDETRKNRAKEYVVSSDITFEEIAFLLGFTEHGNFSRAFKRWFDCTPGVYRTKFGHTD